MLTPKHFQVWISKIDEMGFIPQAGCELAGDDVEMFEKFLGALNDNDDVQRVFHNAEFS